MHGLARLPAGAALLASVLMVAASASASVTGMRGDRHEDGLHPCHYYLTHEMPAPKRCYGYFYDVIGPDVYVNGGLVFQDRDAFRHFRESGQSQDERWADREERARESQSGESYRADADQDRDYDREAGSGGASRGAKAAAGSGGASRGGRIPPNVSGGASGY